MTEMDGEKKMPIYARLAMADPKSTSRLRDSAKGGYFTLQDLRGTGHEHDYHVQGYDCNGNHLLSTWHIGDHSMQMERDVWRGRGATQKALDSKNIRRLRW
jgi:hypothetical protein